MGTNRHEILDPYVGADDLSQYIGLFSRRFQNAFKGAKKLDQDQVRECVSQVLESAKNWRNRSVKKPSGAPGQRRVRTARINDGDRLIFEGPFATDRFLKPVIVLHDFCRHDDQGRRIAHILHLDPTDELQDAIDLTEDDVNPSTEPAELETSAQPFALFVPALAFADPDLFREMLQDAQGFSPTDLQAQTLITPRPFLIHGMAGSGKTHVLCHRVAASIRRAAAVDTKEDILYLAHSAELVEHARRTVEKTLETIHFLSAGQANNVHFLSFAEFMRRYLPGSALPGRAITTSDWSSESYVAFGHFRRAYETTYARGKRRPPSAEVAWHAIRSLLKGSCIPELDGRGRPVPGCQPPLSKIRYKELAKRRKEFGADQFEELYAVGLWYQEYLKEHRLWDDQDMAWSALLWVMQEQHRNPGMRTYAEVFCDEVQDLTEIEFKLLVSLCKPALPHAPERLALALAGDPLQTINPTGFRWKHVGASVYSVSGEPISRTQLAENFRTDCQILQLANKIQTTRALVLGEDVVDQVGFDKEGRPPSVVAADAAADALLNEAFRSLPDRSAVLVWPEDRDELSALYSSTAFDGVDIVFRRTITEAKGLEFRQVFLYKLGSDPEVRRWWDAVPDGDHPANLSQEQEIPLLYLLNRLYVAATRAELYLFIVDEPEAIERFWRRWLPTNTEFVKPAGLASFLRDHPALQRLTTRQEWAQWAGRLHAHAEATLDLVEFRRARDAFLKAGDSDHALRMLARIEEISHEWSSAGDTYFKLGDFNRSATAFERGKQWDRALLAADAMPVSPDVLWRRAFYRFQRDRLMDELPAAIELFRWISNSAHGDGVSRETLSELADVFERHVQRHTQLSGDTARVLTKLADIHGDRSAAKRAAKLQRDRGEYAEAVRLFVFAGESGTDLKEVQAEAAVAEGRYDEAAGLFIGLGKNGRLLEFADRLGTDEFALVLARSFEDAARHADALEWYRRFLAKPSAARGDADTRNAQVGVGRALELLGNPKEAIAEFVKGRHFSDAARVAAASGRPKEEVLRYKVSAALGKMDFRLALELARDVGDPELLSQVQAESLRHGGDRRSLETMKRFAATKNFQDVIETYFEVALFSDSERPQAWELLVDALNEPRKGTLSRDLRRRIEGELEEISDVVEDTKIDLPSFGRCMSEYATFVRAAEFFECYDDQEWAREGWLRVKQRQIDHHSRQPDRVEQIRKSVARKQADWRRRKAADE